MNGSQYDAIEKRAREVELALENRLVRSTFADKVSLGALGEDKDGNFTISSALEFLKEATEKLKDFRENGTEWGYYTKWEKENRGEEI